MDKRLEENLDEHRDELADIGAKMDLALELLERLATGGNVQVQELEDWKQRCRQRAQVRRDGRKRRRR